MNIWKQRYDEMIITCAHTGRQRDEALEKLKLAEERIDELKQDRDIIHQDAERWRKIAAEWKARHDEIHIANAKSPDAGEKGKSYE
jgi:hypothetical protein